MKAQRSAAASHAVLSEASLLGRQAQETKACVTSCICYRQHYSKRLYKIPRVKSATQNLYSKGKAHRNTHGRAHTLKGGKGSLEWSVTLRTPHTHCAASGHPGPEG